MLGFQTIRQGERAAVWHVNGSVRYVDGPKRLLLFRETASPMQRFSAEADQFLVVRYRNGVAQHLRGPCEMWFDPVEHESVQARHLLPLDANEALVVYRREDGDQVNRRVLRGPLRYMPEPDEWLHEFTWHGSDEKNPRIKLPNRLKFHKLRVIPDQMYVDVRDVRTADDALVTVQTMLFFELVDVDGMLNQTHDPIADFLNAVSADVIEFAAGRSFEQFKRDTEQLSGLESFSNLTTRAERIGYRINKVVYRGYEANPKLQAMHDGAIEARTSLQLQAETERQAQELADLKLGREATRARQARDMQREQSEHEQHLKQLVHREALRQQEAEHTQTVTFKQRMNALEVEHERETHAEQTAYLQTMRDLQIDLTRYLVAQYQHPDRLIRIEGAAAEKAQLHLRS